MTRAELEEASRDLGASLLEEIERLETDNAFLRKENKSLWESVHELQDMANRAHTEDA